MSAIILPFLVCAFSNSTLTLTWLKKMAGKDLNLFDECAAECVPFSPQEEE